MSIEKTIWPGSTQLAPVPVVLVGTGDGKLHPWNVITVAWAGTVASTPPMVSVSIRRERFSFGQLELLKCFTVNIPSADMAETVDYCGVVSGSKVDKFAVRGLTAVPGSKVTAPIVAECPLSLECSLVNSVDLGSHVMFIGKIEAVQVTSALIDEQGKLDLNKTNLLAYAHGHYYSLGKEIGFFGYSVKK